jgi:PAS domain S-box-containing protein
MHTDLALESLFRTGDGVFAVDDEQCIIFWNQGAEAILGHTPEEVMGKRCFLIIRGVDEEGQVSCIQDCPILSCARQGRLSPAQNLQVRAKDGLLRWLSVTHTFVGPFDNHPGVVVHIFRDATPEIEAKRLLASLAEQLSGFGSPQGREEGGYSPPTELTEREKQVLVLLAQGQGTSSIAKKLTISNTTARNHIQNVLAKLGVHTRLEAVAYASRHSLVDPGPVSEKQAPEVKV